MQTVTSLINGSSKTFFHMEIGHEILSTAILSLPLIQVGQLSVTGKRMFDLSLPRKSVDSLTDRLNTSVIVDWDVKPQNKQTKQIKIVYIVIMLKQACLVKIHVDSLAIETWKSSWTV